MKKINYLILSASIMIAACGGQSNNATEDATKLCECYKAGTKDVTKMGDCEKMEDELKTRYEKGSDDYKLIGEVMEKCEDEIKGETDGD